VSDSFGNEVVAFGEVLLESVCTCALGVELHLVY